MSAPADTTDLWIRRFHRSPSAKARLMVLPHAGGAASYFFPMSRDLAPDVEVLSVQYPGRQDRRAEPLMETVADLADAIADLITDTADPGDPPLALFGHSMGASVGFEVAVRLRAAGIRPACLIASGRRAPSAFRDERVHERDDDGVLDEVRELNRVDRTVIGDDEILRMALPAIRADYRAIETYACPAGRRVRCPVTVLIGDQDPKVTPEEAGNWGEHTEGGLRLAVFPGGHFFLARQQSAVNAELQRELTALAAGIAFRA